MAVDLYVQDDNNIVLDVPTNDLDLQLNQPVMVDPDYEHLKNLPQINHVTLIGDKSFADLGLVEATEESSGLMSAEDKTILDNIDETYVDWEHVDHALNSMSENPIDNKTVTHMFDRVNQDIAGKQDLLTFDDVPTEGSSNPVTSDGIYDAIETAKDLIPTKTSELENDSGFITDAGVTSFNGQTGDITYSAPVTSVNGQTGDVTGLQEQLTFDDQPTQDSNNPVTSGGIYDAIEYAKQDVRQDIADVRADIPTKTSELENDGYDGTSTYVEADQLATVATSGAYTDLTGQPTDLSDFNNDSGFVNATEAANAAPVQSVNGQIGTVTLDASDVGALPDTTSIPTKTSDLQNDGSDGTSTYVETDDLPEVHNIPAGGNAGQILKKISATDYDVHWADQTQYYPSGYSTTAADKQTKQIACSSWTATAKSYLHILLTHANTYAGKLYFTVNAVNTYEVWINGTVSSATNYSLPAGTYIIYFDGSAFQVRTDGIIPASVNGTAARIPYGECDNTSTSTAFTATVPGITELKDGVTMLLYNGVVTSASGFTININGLGAKPSYNNMTLGNPVTPTTPTRDTTIFNINYAFLFVYSETLVSGGCWIGYRGYDANTNTIGYQLRTNNTTMKTADKFYRYRLLFTSADGTKWIPANTSTSTNATSVRTPNTRAIDPFGEIVWYGTTTAIEANANVTAGQLWQEYYSSYTNIGYSFNNTGAAQTMTANLPIYIKCTPQADGSAIIDPTTPYTQTLPTTDDGKIYIYLGRAYNATNFEITMNHPVYYHDGTGIKLWCGGRLMPNPPSTDGTYTLQCTVSSGVATYSWI